MEIKNLPTEIQEVIFTYLDIEDLLNMMLVDSNTKSIIENSPTLMSRMPIIVTDDEEFYDETQRSIEPLICSTRRVSKIIVKLKHNKIMSFLGIFKKFSDTVRYLDIHDYTFETLDQLRLLLRYLNNLTKLSVYNVLFTKSENKLLNSIVRLPNLYMSKLREIQCVNSDIRLFTLFLNNYDIHLRKIRLKFDGHRISNCRDFSDMMSQQVFIKSLTFDGVTSENCNLFEFGNFLRCRLDRLEILNCELTKEHMRSLLDMIKSQSDLKVLKMVRSPVPSSLDVIYVHRQLFSNHLTEVHVDINNLLSFYNHSFSNESIRNLTINGNFAFENLPVFINFIRIFPNVDKLKLIGDMPVNDKYLFYILSTLAQLEELSVPGFTSRTFDSNFSNLASVNSKLKVLILDYIDYDVKYFGWKNIVSYVGSIEKLIIKRGVNSSVANEIVDVIIKKLRLKHLELGSGIVSQDSLCNIVYNNYCSDLKVLKVSTSDCNKMDMRVDFWRLFKNNRLLLNICEDEYFLKD